MTRGCAVEGGMGKTGFVLRFTRGWHGICHGGSRCVSGCVGWVADLYMCACTIRGCIVIPLGLARGWWEVKGVRGFGVTRLRAGGA